MAKFKNKIVYLKLFSNINDDFKYIRKDSKSLFIRLLFYHLTIFHTQWKIIFNLSEATSMCKFLNFFRIRGTSQVSN